MTFGDGLRDQLRSTELKPAFARRPDGGAGRGGSGRAVATLDGPESPDRFVARTRKSYVVPFVKYRTVFVQHVVTGMPIRCHEPPRARYSIQYHTSGVGLAAQRSVT
jgi:hypothetical protein